MKEKAIIIYQKGNDPLKKVVLNCFNKAIIVNTIFKDPFQRFIKDNTYDNTDYYEIKPDINFLYLNNVTFYQKVKFLCPNETIFVLDNCNFKENILNFNGGYVTLKNPKLPNYYYCNRIYGSSLESFSFTFDNNQNNLHLSLNSKNICTRIYDGSANINLKGNDITATITSDLASLNIDANSLKITSSNITLKENDKKSSINSNSMELINSSILSSSNLDISTTFLTLDDKSTISTNKDNDIIKEKNTSLRKVLKQ